MSTPQFHNIFGQYDKKLTKNVIKRVVVEPFSDRIMARQEGECFEVHVYREDSETLRKICRIFTSLFKKDKIVSLPLKDYLADPLSDFAKFLASVPVKGELSEEIEDLEEIKRKCSMLDIRFDFYQLQEINQALRDKQPIFMDRYLKIISGLVEKAVVDVGSRR